MSNTTTHINDSSKHVQDQMPILTETISMGGSMVRLNGRARSADAKPIKCRHLSYAVLVEGFKKKFLSKLTTVESIESLDVLQNNTIDDENELQNGSYYYFSYFQNIGETLHNLSLGMEVGDSRLFLLLTDNHAMCIKLRCKNNLFVVSFYDPNHTNEYRKITLVQSDLKALCPINFLSKAFQQRYFTDSSWVVLVSYLDMPEKKSYYIDPRFAPHDTINVALSYGLSTVLNRQLEEVFARGDLTNTQKTEFLAAKKGNGVPGLFVALEQGHAKAVEIYLEQVLTSALTRTQKVELLAAKDPYSWVPGLFHALEQGHVKVVKIYLELVLASTLTREQKGELLTAKAPCLGKNGLFMALQRGHTKVVDIYIRQVLASTLADAQKVELIAVRTISGSGLSVALNNKHFKTAKVYFNNIVNTPLFTQVLAEHWSWGQCKDWAYLKDEMIKLIEQPNLSDVERQEFIERFSSVIDLHRNPLSRFISSIGLFPSPATQTRQKINTQYPGLVKLA